MTDEPHPAERALDEVLDELADEADMYSPARQGAEKMHDRWRNHEEPSRVFDQRDMVTFEEAIETWGVPAQEEMAEEEAAELLLELAKAQYKLAEFIVSSKHRYRGKMDQEEFEDELADVRIMWEQLMLLSDRDNVEAQIREKMERLRERVQEEKRDSWEWYRHQCRDCGKEFAVGVEFGSESDGFGKLVDVCGDADDLSGLECPECGSSDHSLGDRIQDIQQSITETVEVNNE